ncbi:MAG: hypothetical protein ACE5IY_08745 [bacterium]
MNFGYRKDGLPVVALLKRIKGDPTTKLKLLLETARITLSVARGKTGRR